jgi:hypothetical protein
MPITSREYPSKNKTPAAGKQQCRKGKEKMEEEKK